MQRAKIEDHAVSAFPDSTFNPSYAESRGHAA
jgi:hypothetical protein